MADGYTLQIDGPLSLFSATNKYGLQMALFLPSLLACATSGSTPSCAGGRSASRGASTSNRMTASSRTATTPAHMSRPS